MGKAKSVILLSTIFLLLYSLPAFGANLSAYGNIDLNTLVYNPMVDVGISLNLSNLTTGLRFYTYKQYPMLSQEDPLAFENNPTCYLGQYFVEYIFKPFKLSFKHNFFRTNEIVSFDLEPEFTYLREAFPTFSLGASYVYEGDIHALLSFAYNFNNQYTTEIMVEKDFWRRFTFGAKNTTYMYMTKKGWSISGSPICQLYEVYLKLHLSNNIYAYFNDWCYHPVVSEARKSAYYNPNSRNPMGLSIGLNFKLK